MLCFTCFVLQTLYTYPDNFRASNVLIAAQYSGANVTVAQDPPQFVLGETNKSADFLKKFPLGKVTDSPCFVILKAYIHLNKIKGCFSRLSLITQDRKSIGFDILDKTSTKNKCR